MEADTFDTIPFTELKRGQVFRFAGQKKIFEVKARLKAAIEYFPHSDVWGDYRQKRKTTKLQVEINFHY